MADDYYLLNTDTCVSRHHLQNGTWKEQFYILRVNIDGGVECIMCCENKCPAISNA